MQGNVVASEPALASQIQAKLAERLGESSAQENSSAPPAVYELYAAPINQTATAEASKVAWALLGGHH